MNLLTVICLWGRETCVRVKNKIECLVHELARNTEGSINICGLFRYWIAGAQQQLSPSANSIDIWNLTIFSIQVIMKPTKKKIYHEIFQNRKSTENIIEWKILRFSTKNVQRSKRSSSSYRWFIKSKDFICFYFSSKCNKIFSKDLEIFPSPPFVMWVYFYCD